MAIPVICSGCKKRFQVSDQFAGRTGPCPHCKTSITIPEKGPEVKVHAPEEFESGGRSRTGKLIIKPVAHRDAKWNPVVATGIGGAVLAVAGVALFAGSLFQEFALARLLGLLVVSPPLVIAGYTVLHDDELEPYAGRPLYVRSGLCAMAYLILWVVFGYVAAPALTGDAWYWFFVAPPFLFVGALAGFATLDLGLGNAFFQYAFYLLVTILLRWLAGMGWLWNIGIST